MYIRMYINTHLHTHTYVHTHTQNILSQSIYNTTLRLLKKASEMYHNILGLSVSDVQNFKRIVEIIFVYLYCILYVVIAADGCSASSSVRG